MIKKAIYSYWEDNRKKVNGGYTSKKNLAISLTLSVELALKQFEEVELITNTYGKNLLIDKYKVPFTSVKVVLDQFDNILNPDFWAYVKIFTYSIQEEPFVHIDNDVILWDKIPDNILNSPLFFQNKEKFTEHKGYLRLVKEAKGFAKINFDIIMSEIDYAYNCGVIGVNDLSVIREWKSIVDEYLFSAKNQMTWNETPDKHSHNHLFEQFFISALIKNRDISVECLLKDNFYRSAYVDFKMTHLWGEAKRNPLTMKKVKDRLFNDYPKYREIFSSKETHSDIFEDIYKNELWGAGLGSGSGSSAELTFEYRKFLEKFLRDKHIRTVADYGCGDWQFSKLIDWDGIIYTGYDCVGSIIENNRKQFDDNNVIFIKADTIKTVLPAQLLIIKDVLIHWTNEEIIEFLNDIKTNMKFKYVLITNQTGEDNQNKEISTGEFHNIDINKDPFNINAEIVFKWRNDSKTTYLISL